MHCLQELAAFSSLSDGIVDVVVVVGGDSPQAIKDNALTLRSRLSALAFTTFSVAMSIPVAPRRMPTFRTLCQAHWARGLRLRARRGSSSGSGLSLPAATAAIDMAAPCSAIVRKLVWGPRA